MTRPARLLHVLLPGAVALSLAQPAWALGFKEARIYIEFNSSANDLGFHVSLDAEDWESLRIEDPTGTTNFEVESKGGYTDLGLTELFFEGAEPPLDEFPLADLLARFPEGKYEFIGVTVGGEELMSMATLTHAVPAGPVVSAEVGDDTVIIRWDAVTGPPDGFPRRKIKIAGYQIIVEDFQVTLPASSREVTVPEEFVESLARGEHPFEVLAIDVSGNQTITEGFFEID